MYVAGRACPPWRKSKLFEQIDRSGELFAFQHADRRSLDWKNAPERRRLYRLLNAAQQLIKDGYRRLLKPDSE
ncbi:DUF2285 domain-containing protein [Sinorhizobium meliloti]|nr:DUF2285 domain-containing protein [Sinorhizobium meliloti]RVN83173.1 DUF2285 domain-containing protein [Sinorhizobium meliloti]RVO04624.1 DUF2285 domain-containing protein [Sinorhizobium meliloti]